MGVTSVVKFFSAKLSDFFEVFAYFFTKQRFLPDFAYDEARKTEKIP